MKTVFSRIYSVVLTFAALSLTVFSLYGCKPEEGESSEIMLSESTVEVKSSGGQVTVTYELMNSDGNVTAEPSDEWINGVDTSEKGVIKFNVDRNEGDDSRTAVLEISAPSVKEPAVLTVVQKESEPFATEIIRTTETGIDFRIIPENPEMTYVATIIDKERFDKIGGKEKYFEYIVDFYKSEAAEYDMTIEDFLVKSEALVSGEKLLNIRNLYVDTQYVIVIFGMDTDCSLLSVIVTVDFKTKSAEMLDIDFDITYEVKGNSVKMTVVPSDDDVYYYYNIIKKSDLDASGSDIEKHFQGMINSFISNGTSIGYTVQEVVAEICSKGQSVYDYKSIDPLTDFVGYAFALSESGLISSEVSSEPFRTEDVNPSENEISLIVENISSDRANISVVTTNTDPYLLIIDKASNWEPFETDQDKIDELFSGRHNLEKYIRNGNADGMIKSLVPDTDYIVMAIGYFYGKPTTSLVKDYFRTLKEEVTFQMDFNFTIENITPYSVDVTVNGDPASSAYYWGIVDENATVEEIELQTDEMVEYYMMLGYGRNRAEVMRSFTRKAQSFSQFSELNPDTAYKIFACGVDESTGEFTGEMIFSDVFRTEVSVLADVKATVEFDKMFDCQELSELDPSFPNAPFALIPLTLKLEGEAAGFYYYAFEEDLSDPVANPDIKIINRLKSYGESVEMNIEYQSFYDTYLTVVAVAYDSEGNYGPVFRKKIYVSKASISPAEEYFNVN